MQAGSKVILRLRAEKALENMKTLLGGAQSREDVRQIVIESWQRAEMKGVGKKDNVEF